MKGRFREMKRQTVKAKYMNVNLGNAYKILVGKPEGKRSFGRNRCRWEVISEWILGKLFGKLWTEFFCLRIGPSGGLL
jgi:hypothetical protein